MATRTFKIMCSAHIIFLLDCAAIGSWKPLRDFVQDMNVIRLGFYFLIFFLNFLNYESMVTHLQETWKIQNKITYSSPITVIISSR